MPKYKFSEIAYNITDKKMPEPGDEELYIGLEHLDSGSLRVTRWGSEVELVGQKLVMQKGDILFGRRNTYLRRAAIAPHDGIFSAHGMIFRPNTAIIDPDYFPFFISSDYFMDAAIRISVGSLSPTVNWKTLKELEFFLPDLNQQRHTAELLSAANETKEAYQDLLIKSDELVKSQFIELFGDPNINPKGWKQSTVGQECYYIKDGPHKSPPYIDDPTGIPFISTRNVVNGDGIDWSTAKYISEESYRECIKKCKPEKGDILYSKGGTTGIAKLVDTDIKFANWVHVAVLKFGSNLDGKFFECMLNTDYCYAQSQQLTKGVVNRDFVLSAIAKVRIIVPPLPLQLEFVDFIKQLDKSKFELKQAIGNISELIKSLIQQDFSN